ncbi:MAG: hypothetical protein ACREQ9_06340, partial [Candidatus Binatia bacterium]
IVESYHEATLGDRPAGVFFEGAELAEDPTNWWGFNRAGIAALIRAAGFREAREVGIRNERVCFHAIV